MYWRIVYNPQQLTLEFDTIDSLRRELEEVRQKENDLLNLRVNLVASLQATCKHPREARHRDTSRRTNGNGLHGMHPVYCEICRKEFNHF